MNKTLLKNYEEACAVEHAFPKLAESKDERIRKNLVEFLDDVWHLGKDANFNRWGKADCADWIAYLERQKVQNPSAMTQEEKQLLIKDLCARLPYMVKIATRQYNYCDILTPTGIVGDRCYFNDNPRYDGDCPIDEIKLYLRSMSSMTEEERSNLRAYCRTQEGIIYDIGVSGAINSPAIIDWLNKHHFDYRRLIEKGLALEAPEGMYKTE